MKNKIVFGLLVMAALIYLVITKPWVDLNRSVPGLTEPKQTEARGGTELDQGDYHFVIQFLYAYDIEALVVHTRHYDSGSAGDKLGPVDLGLAWGKVAENNGSINFHWDHGNRFLYWRVDSQSDLAKVGGDLGINSSASNNHLIPCDKKIRKIIKKIKTGDVVHLKGYLVNVDGTSKEGRTFSWYSSTSRTDQGDGACEVFYVTDAEIVSSAK